MNTVIKVEDISKTYGSGRNELTVLSEINFSILKGESVSIIGSSGSGKTTLLGLCAGLDQPSSGRISIYDKELSNLTEDQRAQLRNDHIGFIFQNFQLIPTLTAVENVMIPMELKKMPNAFNEAKDLLDRVGLADRFDHYPNQLSGGEQQRVSLARAFANKPSILFADEPTGNLDDETSMQVEKLIFDLNNEKGTTLIIVTHDLDLAKKTDRLIKLKGGKVILDQYAKELA